VKTPRGIEWRRELPTSFLKRRTWRLGPTFGPPTSRFACTTPRTFRFSVGVRFWRSGDNHEGHEGCEDHENPFRVFVIFAAFVAFVVDRF